MKRTWNTYWMTYGVVVVLFGTVFKVGIFDNPTFDIHEFCMGLSTEILGAVIALMLIDRYMTLKIARKEAKKAGKGAGETTGA